MSLSSFTEPPVRAVEAFAGRGENEARRRPGRHPRRREDPVPGPSRRDVGLGGEIGYESQNRLGASVELLEEDLTGAFVQETQPSEEDLLEDVHRPCPECLGAQQDAGHHYDAVNRETKRQVQGRMPFRRAVGPVARNVTSPNSMSGERWQKSVPLRRRARRCRAWSGVSPFRLTEKAPVWRFTARLSRHANEGCRQSLDIAERNAHHIGSGTRELRVPIGQILGQEHLGDSNAEVALRFLRLTAGRVREHEHAQKNRCCSSRELESSEMS